MTAFIDVRDKVLFWCVCAWEEGFTGYVLDYGTYPDQRRRYFTLRDAKRTLGRACPGEGPPAPQPLHRASTAIGLDL